jgi:polyvinyl alcohol dehydrogenase (cytochrome)
VYALDAGSGCLHWTYTADDEVRTAISVSTWQGDDDRSPAAAPILYFGDRKGYVYAVNAITGEAVWKVRPESHPLAIITGAPKLYQDVLYVPVSSKEEANAGSPNYLMCCTFRGSVVALKANTGEKLWQTYTIPVAASEQGKNAQGRLLYGPAGAVVYHSPTIDKQRNLLYFGTDNNYTGPDTNSNTIFAISLKEGAIIWKRQMTAGNIFNYACVERLYSPKQHRFRANCPDENLGHLNKLLGFAAPPVVVKGKDGKEVLVAGQKNGWMWGLDPDSGALVWKHYIAPHHANRGVGLGMTAEQGIIFGTISAAGYNPSQGGGPEGAMEELGIVALNAMTGEMVWKARAMDHCSKEPCSGYYSSLTAIPGVLFAGSDDGFLRAFDSQSGKLLWEFDAALTFTTLNGTTAQGGSFSGDGPVIANGNVYINSGNGYSGDIPGNIFLVFSVDGK